MFSLSAMGQHTLTGTIKNQQQQPVLGASVSLVGDPSKKTITDENGCSPLRQRKGITLRWSMPTDNPKEYG